MFWNKKCKPLNPEALVEQLSRDVLMAWKATNDEEYIEWLQTEQLHAPAILRFQAAAAWYYAELYLTSWKIDADTSNPFMKEWRISMYREVLNMTDADDENDQKQAWENMFTDAASFIRLLREGEADQSHLKMMKLIKRWFNENAQINTNSLDVLKHYLYVANSVSESEIRVHNTLYPYFVKS